MTFYDVLLLATISFAFMLLKTGWDEIEMEIEREKASERDREIAMCVRENGACNTHNIGRWK